LLMFLRDKCR